MGKVFNKIHIRFAVAVIAAFCTTPVFSADVSVGASAVFRTALGFEANSNLDFSSISFTPDASGTIRLATDGSIIYSDGYSGTGSGIPGSLTVSGDLGETVDISCESSGALSNGTENIPLTNVEIAIGGGVSAGSGAMCQGLGSVTTSHTLAALSAQNKILIGGELDGSTTPTATGAFDSASSGGDAVTIRVVYR